MNGNYKFFPRHFFYRLSLIVRQILLKNLLLGYSRDLMMLKYSDKCCKKRDFDCFYFFTKIRPNVLKNAFSIFKH
jgi:hypothetical protein